MCHGRKPKPQAATAHCAGLHFVKAYLFFCSVICIRLPHLSALLSQPYSVWHILQDNCTAVGCLKQGP
jgi:hypothetical protein